MVISLLLAAPLGFRALLVHILCDVFATATLCYIGLLRIFAIAAPFS